MGDPPQPSCRASSPVHAKGCSAGSLLRTPSSAGMKKETMTSRETTQHGMAQAHASRVELGLDPGTLAVLLQEEGLSPSQHRALSARSLLKGHKKHPFGGCNFLIRQVSPMTSGEEFWTQPSSAGCWCLCLFFPCLLIHAQVHVALTQQTAPLP